MKCPDCGEELIKAGGKLVCLDCGSSGRPVGSKEIKPKKISKTFDSGIKVVERKTNKERQPQNLGEKNTSVDEVNIEKIVKPSSEFSREILEYLGKRTSSSSTDVKTIEDNRVKGETPEDSQFEEKDFKEPESPPSLEFELKERFDIHRDWQNKQKIKKLGKNIFYLLKENTKRFIKMLKYYLEEVYNNFKGEKK